MNKLLNKALSEVSNLKPGTVFSVKDLFKGYKWNELSTEERRNLGRLFCMESMNPHLQSGSITALPPIKNRTQLYRKER